MLREKGYDYGTIWLPHDAKAKTLQTGRSTVEQFLEEGFPIDITPSLSIQHGIDAARLLLPHCRFDESTAEGVEALRAYRRQYNQATKTYTTKPLHNWASNGSDAFRYLSLVADLETKNSRVGRLLDQNGGTDYTLDALFTDNEAHDGLAVEKMRI